MKSIGSVRQRDLRGRRSRCSRAACGPITSGCSWISLGMKWRWLPLSDRGARQRRLRAPGASTGCALRVEDLHRAAGHHRPVAVLEIGDACGEGRQRHRIRAENISPSPWPTASGLPRRAAIIRSSSPANSTASANAPSRRLKRRRHRLDGLMPSIEQHGRSDARPPRCRSRVVEAGSRADQLAPSARRKFSMMPLWTTRDALGRVRMGVGLGRRAMRRPARMADAGRAGERLLRSSRASRLSSLPSARGAARSRRSPAWRCRPNRSRDIPAASAHRSAAARQLAAHDADNPAHASPRSLLRAVAAQLALRSRAELAPPSPPGFFLLRRAPWPAHPARRPR